MAASTTTRKIAGAARRLLNKEGAEAVTMRRVASAVGITAMAVYRHYPDRASLLNALADEGFAELAARLAQAPSRGSFDTRLTRRLDICLDHALGAPRLFELMFLDPREGARRFPRDFRARRSPTANLGADLILEGIESGYFGQDDAWEISFALGALWQGLVTLYLGGRMGMSAERFRAFCHRALRRYINGLRS
jgi:AcrR family transcriptional regulator